MAGTKSFIKLNKKCNLKDQLELEKKMGRYHKTSFTMYQKCLDITFKNIYDF